MRWLSFIRFQHTATPQIYTLSLHDALPIYTLQDRRGHADVGQKFRNIPVAELWIEPGAVPAVEGVVDVLVPARSEEHTSELQSQFHLVCRLLLEKKKL